MKTLGSYLREKRIKAELTQEKVSTQLGYKTPQFISNWERGLCSPPLDKLNQIVQMYKISPEEIIQLLVSEQEKLYRQAITPRKSKAR